MRISTKNQGTPRTLRLATGSKQSWEQVSCVFLGAWVLYTKLKYLRAYAVGKVAYAAAVVEEAPAQEPTQEVCLVQIRCAITLKAAYAALPTHENLEVPAQGAYPAYATL